MNVRELYEGMIVLNEGTMVLITEIANGRVSFLNLDTHEFGAYEVINFEVPFQPFVCDGSNAIANYNDKITKVWKKYLGFV